MPKTEIVWITEWMRYYQQSCSHDRGKTYFVLILVWSVLDGPEKNTTCSYHQCSVIFRAWWITRRVWIAALWGTLLALQSWSRRLSIEIIYYHSLLSTKQNYNDWTKRDTNVTRNYSQDDFKIRMMLFSEYEKRYPVICCDTLPDYHNFICKSNLLTGYWHGSGPKNMFGRCFNLQYNTLYVNTYWIDRLFQRIREGRGICFWCTLLRLHS